MSEPEAEPEKPTKSRWGCGCLSLLMLLVGYVLSPGPLFLIFNNMPSNVQIVMAPVRDALFWPLRWCYEHSSVVEAFYAWYVELFDL